MESLSEAALRTYENWKDKEVEVTVKTSPISSFGLFVEEDVSVGGVILEYFAIRFPKRCKEMVSLNYKREGIDEVYMSEFSNTVINATVRGGPLRIGNDSYSPNAEYIEVQLDGSVSAIFAVAICYIPEETEVTFNYRLLTTGADIGIGMRCNCGSANCCGSV